MSKLLKTRLWAKIIWNLVIIWSCDFNIIQLIIRNIDKIQLKKIRKILNLISFNNKYILALNNTNINIIKDLKLTIIKKYWKCIS